VVMSKSVDDSSPIESGGRTPARVLSDGVKQLMLLLVVKRF